jgi:hypothetical protein
MGPESGEQGAGIGVEAGLAADGVEVFEVGDQIFHARSAITVFVVLVLVLVVGVAF